MLGFATGSNLKILLSLSFLPDCHEEWSDPELGSGGVFRRCLSGGDTGEGGGAPAAGAQAAGQLLHPRGQRHQHLHGRGQRQGRHQGQEGAAGGHPLLLRLHPATETCLPEPGM